MVQRINDDQGVKNLEEVYKRKKYRKKEDGRKDGIFKRDYFGIDK